MTKKIVIVDYGLGNANSIKNALAALRVESVYSSQPGDITGAAALILPGVGHHGVAMRSLEERGLVDPLNEAVLDLCIPVLGICLGMQLMTRSSEEGGSHGLGWVNADTRRIVPADRTRFKVPHVGWSTVNGNPECSLLSDVRTEDEPFYFCHSFGVEEVALPAVNSMVDFDRSYVAIFEQGNIFGVQFHPEKSQECGLILLRNFLRHQR
jgi:glutamine amidotransferase